MPRFRITEKMFYSKGRKYRPGAEITLDSDEEAPAHWIRLDGPGAPAAAPAARTSGPAQPAEQPASQASSGKKRPNEKSVI